MTVTMPAKVALAATSTTLPDGFNAIVVDQTNGRLFVSSAETSVITVLDLAGNVVNILEDLPGAAGMALVGDSLYVALFEAGAVEVIDTKSLTRIRRLADGALVEPRSIVYAAERLWTTSGTIFEKKLVAIDPATGAVAEYDNPIPWDTMLTGSPTDPNLLLGWDRLIKVNTGFVRWDLSTEPPTVAAGHRSGLLVNTKDIKVSLDGTKFHTAASFPYSVSEHRVSDLELTGSTNDSDPYPTSVALTPAMGGLIAGGSSSPYFPDIKAYRVGDPSKSIFTHDFDTGVRLFSQGLAFSPDGTKIYGVTGTELAYYGEGSARLHVLHVDRTAVAGYGWNGYGQLGRRTGLASEHQVRSKISSLGRATDVAAGFAHSAAVTTDGAAWTWGWNGAGQLGDGSLRNRPEPVRAAELTNVADVSAGWMHTLALKKDGTVWAWGWNVFGQLGDGTLTDRRTPVQVKGLTDVVAVSAGSFHNFALRSDGTVWAWGWNVFGQLGDGTQADRPVPVRVPSIHSIVEVSAGTYHSLAAGGDGKAYAWGWNGFGQLGDGTLDDRITPTVIPDLRNVRQVAAGFAHSHSLNAAGDMHSWGWNAFGQLGSGSWDHSTPQRTFFHGPADDISAGFLHSVALFNGRVYGWGWNVLNQLGPLERRPLTYSDEIQGTIGGSSAAAGGYHTIVAIPDP
ncbi:MAG TPA: hypothetical protein VHL54_01025 [Actinomycetota bacterium]|nr:hypothetical protein [Actinomycetota bacterium]